MEPLRQRPALPLLVGIGLLVAGAIVGVVLVATSLPTATSSVGVVDAGPAVAQVPDDAGGYALWARDAQGGPLRWDACAPIEFVLNDADAPPHAEADLRTALGLLSEASGLTLVLVGRTDESPRAQRPLVVRDGAAWRWRPVLVAWARPGEGDLPLTPLDRGVALPVAVRAGDREAYVTGQVVLNAAREDLVAGFADRSVALGATLVHELAHVLGLAHVDDPGELMWVEPGTGPVVLGPGDRAGLRAIGASAGCRAAPDPLSGRGLTAPR